MSTRTLRGAFAALSIIFCTNINAGDARDRYAEYIDAARTIGALDDNLFGDSINDYSGSVTFSVSDVSLPGNNGLDVGLARRYIVKNDKALSSVNRLTGLLSDWDIDLPYIGGTFATDKGWVNPDGSASRCSIPSEPTYYNYFMADEYWAGNSLYIPGIGSEEMGVSPTSGEFMTKSRWRFDCLPSTTSGEPGEAFLAIAPNGNKYWFTQMTRRTAGVLTKPVFGVQTGAASASKLSVKPGGITPSVAAGGVVGISLSDIRIYPTRIEDKHGNWVQYQYDATQKNRLLSITSGDGRQLTLTYNANGAIATATDGVRTWTYNYSATTKYLTSVVLPDGRSWSYNLDNLNKSYISSSGTTFCGTPGGINQTLATGTMTHPSGAMGSFTFQDKWHGRSYVQKMCRNFYDSDHNLVYTADKAPAFFTSFSLLEKSITGSGAALKKWTWSYPALNFSYTSDCVSSACVASKSITKTNPDGNKEIYVFGTKYQDTDGTLLLKEVRLSSGLLLSQFQQSQQIYNTGLPYEQYPVYSLQEFGDPSTFMNRPIRLQQTTQDTVTYTNQVNAFDAFARPIDVTRSNTNGFSKTEATTYSDNLTKWVLGQVATVTDVATGLVEQSNSYDPVNANLLSKTVFGVLQESYTYNADGTLATIKDGKNNTYTLGNWKRGIPQLITAPDTNTQSGVVNDSGWLTSVTNQRGYVTGYSYDAMGRLASITPPSGDTVAWAGTTLTFTPLTTATYGVPVGGWKHSISRGNYRKETYLDALYRPLVIREFDNANVAGTQRFTTKAYDTLNREVFSAYPGVTSTLTAGARTTYDALGRVIENKADSEMGVLTTTTEYLTGGGIKVTGPDGNFTTRSFRSLDGPSYEQMMTEIAPGGVTTSISRDVFGKPLTLTRSGSDGLSLSKQFAYDTNQRLCMRTEPETGSSIIDYDAAGNVLWAANGQAVANPALCNRAAAISTAKINYTYDSLNRITGTDVPNSSNDPTVTYFPDGTVNTLTNGSAVWSYTYNKLGKPVTESLNLSGKISTITHAYDTLANEASLTYPSGSNIAYLPNALGQASKADTYATGLTYRASGFLSGMTYSNGAIYSALPNLRGLPARRLDKKGTTVITDELIGYDQDANPVCVRDSTTGNPGNRDFTFDARNRLIKASAPNQAWISSEYQYDSLDNIKLARLGTRHYNYSQNALNQLASITQPSTTPSAANYGLSSCADASLTADLGNGSTGPSVAIPSAGTAGSATTGGAQTAKYTFTTDNEGRMTQKGTQAYVYDALNRMTQVTTKESYVYDGHGRRVQTTKTSDGSINYPLYSLDGKLILEDNRQTLQRIEYIHAGGRLLAKKIQPITAAGANNGTASTTTIHTDFLGSPVAETNASGTVTRVERYTPYGEPSDMQLDAGPGFTGHTTDVATGLTNMQQRYMDAELGRFLTPDPVGPEEDFIKHFNRYNYAQNNPVRYTDPDGRESGAGYANSEYQMAQPTCNSTCTNIAGNVADFIPIIGDVKGIVEAYKNPTIITVSAAIVGLVPGAGDIAGKAIKNSDKLLGMAKMVGGFKTLSSGAIQGSVKGDASAIYKSLTKGATETKSGMMKTKDGTLIGQHTSTKNGVPTIDIKTKDGQVYKIRIIEDKKK